MISLINSSVQKIATHENKSSLISEWVKLGTLWKTKTKRKHKLKKLKQTQNKRKNNRVASRKEFFIAI
jgi:hypothetical protein